MSLSCVATELCHFQILDKMAVLDFAIAEKWHQGTLRAVHGHQHTKFRKNIWNSGWVMAIFLFSKWRPAAILNFVTGQKWRNSTLRTVHVYHRAKFDDNISNSGWVMSIFRFSKWRPAAILNLVQPSYGTTHDGALAVWSVLSNFVLIWLIVSKILNIQFFLRLAWNCLTTPTFWGFMGFDTLNNFFSSKPPKDTSFNPWVKPRRLKYRSWKSAFAVGDDEEKRKGKVSHNLGLYFSYMGSLDRFLRKLADWKGPMT